MLRSLRAHLFTPERPGRSDGNDAAGRALDGAGLLEAIVCETHLASVHTAVIASGLNALRTRGRLKNPLALKNFLPSESAVIGELLRRDEDAELSPAAKSQILQFFGDLPAARATMERFLADADRLGVERAANSHHVSLIAAWSALCERAMSAIEALEADIRGRLPEYYAHNSIQLFGLLKKAASGQQPCLDEAGNPHLPDLPQRRQAARRSLLQEGTLRHRGKASQVIARDISITGLGIERTPPELKTGELVQIELAGGRRLMGLVVWTNGSTAGIRLGKPLTPNDPLLTG